MTALDTHREQNADEAKIVEIEKQIEAAGVEFIYYQVVTVSGRVLSKVVPARHLRRNLHKGVLLHRTGIADLQANRAGDLMGGGAGAAEFNAVPDIDTFQVLPWDTSLARFFCTLFEPDHRVGNGGSPFDADARGVLKRTHAEFTQATGLVLKTGCEPEMTWTGPGLEVHVRPDASPAYHFEQLERMRPIYQSLIRYSQAMGLDMIEGDYEDSGQLELNWMFDRAELTADRLMTYRLICKQVAREHGVTASFMPKPAMGTMGNGCHHNLSLWDGEANALEDGSSELHLTPIGRDALAGLLHHAAGSMIVMGQTVNSYKRYWDIGQFAPTKIDWGMDDKTCTVRLPAVGRLEYKLPDASVNPYLSHTLLLAAMRDGIDRKLPLDNTEFPALPKTLWDAIGAFEQDKEMRSAFPTGLSDLLIEAKTDEWARFCGAVTDWEHMMYSEATP
jgi:glutamine synthetase